LALAIKKYPVMNEREVGLFHALAQVAWGSSFNVDQKKLD
jgi:hypothetical protein